MVLKYRAKAGAFRAAVARHRAVAAARGSHLAGSLRIRGLSSQRPNSRTAITLSGRKIHMKNRGGT